MSNAGSNPTNPLKIGKYRSVFGSRRPFCRILPVCLSVAFALTGLNLSAQPSLTPDRIKNLQLTAADLALFPQDQQILAENVWEVELRTSVAGSAWVKPPTVESQPFALALESRPLKLPRAEVELGLDWDGETVVCKTGQKAFIVTSESVPGLVTFVPAYSSIKLRPSSKSWLDLEAGESNESEVLILYRTPNASGAAFTGARLLGGITKGSLGRFDLFKNKTFSWRCMKGSVWGENSDGSRKSLIPEAPPIMGGPKVMVISGPFKTQRFVQLTPYQEISLEAVIANKSIVDRFQSDKNTQAEPTPIASNQRPTPNRGQAAGGNDSSLSPSGLAANSNFGNQPASESSSETASGLGANSTFGNRPASESSSETASGLAANSTFGNRPANESSSETASSLAANSTFGNRPASESSSETASALGANSTFGNRPALEDVSGESSPDSSKNRASGQILWERIEVTIGDTKWNVVAGVTEVIEDPETGSVIRLAMDNETGSAEIQVEKGAFQIQIPQFPYSRPLLYSGQRVELSWSEEANSFQIMNPSSEWLAENPQDAVLIDCMNGIFAFMQAGADLIYNPVEAPSKFLVSSSSPVRIYNEELNKVFILKFQVGFMKNGVLYSPGKEVNSEGSRAIAYRWEGDNLVVITEYDSPVIIGEGAGANFSPDGLFEMQITNQRKNMLEFAVESGKFEMIPTELVGWMFRIGAGNSLQVDYNQSIGRMIVKTLPGHQGVSQVKLPDGSLVNLESGGAISFKLKGGQVNLDFVAGGGVTFETPTGFATSINGFPIDVPAGPDGRSMSAFSASGFSEFQFQVDRVVQGPLSGEEP